jgi:CarboxypepD_reg-like domain
VKALPKLVLKVRRSLPAVLLACFGQIASAQVQIKGTVYDKSQRYGLAGVSVIATSGRGTKTDSLGNYHISLSLEDSLYFSYLGKYTSKFPVRELNAGQPFNMSLEVGTDTLPAVFVRTRNYLEDSLETRREYKKIFDYQADYLNNLKAPKGRGMGVGLDMDMLFDHKEVRRMEAFQKRLEDEERDNYIDHRFTPALVSRITGLEPPALDSFMRIYRPSYDFLKTFETDYEFYKYISDCGKFYSSNN